MFCWEQNAAKGLPLIRTCQDFACVCPCARKLRPTFEEARMRCKVAVVTMTGPATCPLTQKCTRPVLGPLNRRRTPRFGKLNAQFFEPVTKKCTRSRFGIPKSRWSIRNRTVFDPQRRPAHNRSPKQRSASWSEHHESKGAPKFTTHPNFGPSPFRGI